MSKVDGRRERGSCGGTTAALTDAMSLRRDEITKKKTGKKGENASGQSGFVHRQYIRTYSSPLE
jgi:hypothetical protein